ncbi:hypothetical protein H696_01748 [Fonticula alba]|uniref:SART-1 protein n=1 Tax=Fonticula alba TaxID=691883 RepID=A0A058ZD69_FONAL|nr:hypothetical protein H696_01748 [Fonticula alba]KCV72355.1 hypothetical protein H696_01748 [Fonticula alba]|eukprot:XP_009493933.1 hypothetical protein H696_01748 [Fonticula alba]
MSGNEESLSLEETNRLRAQLGFPLLKPSDSAPTPPTPAPASGPSEDEISRMRERIESQRATRKASTVPAVPAGPTKSLGEADFDEDDPADTSSWISKHRQRMRKRASSRYDEEDDLVQAQAKSATAAEPAEASLAGLRVAHDLGNLETGREYILTFADKHVLDENSEDELESLDLRENEKIAKRKEAIERSRKGYTAYDDREFTDSYKPGNILDKYDDIAGDGAERKAFYFDESGFAQKNAEAASGRSVTADDVAQRLRAAESISLKAVKQHQQSDFAPAEEVVRFKKTARSAARRAPRVPVSDLIAQEEAELFLGAASATAEMPAAPASTVLDEAPVASYSSNRRRLDDTNFVDDDDLQASLARSRRKKIRSNIRSLDESIQAVRATAPDQDQANTTGVTLSFASEFARQVVANATAEEEALLAEEEAGEGAAAGQGRGATVGDADSSDDDGAGGASMRVSTGADDDEEEGAISDDPDLPPRPDTVSSRRGARHRATAAEPQPAALEVFDEPVVAAGIASALRFVQNKGHLEAPMAPGSERQSVWAAQSMLLERRTAERLRQLRGSNQAARNRSATVSVATAALDRPRSEEAIQAERARIEHEHLNQVTALYRNYDPTVNIRYTDAFGREMTPREAFKELSHKFHGHTSSKNKAEKHLRKVRQEISTDSRTGAASEGQNLSVATGKRRPRPGPSPGTPR